MKPLLPMACCLKGNSQMNSSPSSIRCLWRRQSTGTLQAWARGEGWWRELMRACVSGWRVVQMTEMIRSEVKRAYAEVPIILCRNITGHCKDESTYMAEVKKIAEHL